MSWRWAAYVIKFAVLAIFNTEFLRSRILRVNFAQILAKNLYIILFCKDTES